MKKIDIVNNIAENTGLTKVDIILTLEHFVKEVKRSLKSGEAVYMRGFGSFIIKHKAAKVGRVITKNIQINIPAHIVPSFKPSKKFVNEIKASSKKKRK
ncbi:MAG: HU family DNA-binding protein [Alphaproteobacteria bacterium]|nr:HU family DNA-binding protein [Alphaproteobacteria bacterium]